MHTWHASCHELRCLLACIVLVEYKGITFLTCSQIFRKRKKHFKYLFNPKIKWLATSFKLKCYLSFLMLLLSGWNSVSTVHLCFLMEASQTTNIFLSIMPILKQCSETAMNETKLSEQGEISQHQSKHFRVIWESLLVYYCRLFSTFVSFGKQLYHCINQEPNVGF